MCIAPPLARDIIQARGGDFFENSCRREVKKVLRRPDYCIIFDDCVSREERIAVNKLLTEYDIHGVNHWYDAAPMKSANFMPAPPLAIIIRIYIQDPGSKFMKAIADKLPDGCRITQP